MSNPSAPVIGQEEEVPGYYKPSLVNWANPAVPVPNLVSGVFFLQREPHANTCKPQLCMNLNIPPFNMIASFSFYSCSKCTKRVSQFNQKYGGGGRKEKL